MSAPNIILDHLPSLCQKLSDLVEVWRSYNKNNFACFYPRDAMLARVIVIATCLSVCLSVCPFVTRRYCVKKKKDSGMISSPSDSPKTLVFWRQISSPNSKGFPPKGGLKQGSVGKIQRFLPARRYASAGYRDRNVSVCPSVRHAPVLCQNEES